MKFLLISELDESYFNYRSQFELGNTNLNEFFKISNFVTSLKVVSSPVKNMIVNLQFYTNAVRLFLPTCTIIDVGLADLAKGIHPLTIAANIMSLAYECFMASGETVVIASPFPNKFVIREKESQFHFVMQILSDYCEAESKILYIEGR